MPSFTLENILSADKNQHHGFKLPTGADTGLPDHGGTTGKGTLRIKQFLNLLLAHSEQDPGNKNCPSHHDVR
jgi:hypothetical protein